MRFPRLFSDSGSQAFRALQGRRSSCRCRAQVSLEVLEARDLKAGGVSLGAGGVITILAPLNSGNIAEVDLDHAHNNAVAVTLNGSITEFDASRVRAIVYFGGQGGHDLFVNTTALLGVEYGWGGGNIFVGGSGQDYMFVFGNNNIIDAGSGFGVVYTHRGKDTILGHPLVF